MKIISRWRSLAASLAFALLFTIFAISADPANAQVYLAKEINSSYTLTTNTNALVASGGTTITSSSSGGAGRVFVGNGAGIQLEGNNLIINSASSTSGAGGSLVFEEGSRYLSSSSGRIQLMGNSDNFDAETDDVNNLWNTRNATIIFMNQALQNSGNIFPTIDLNRGEIIFYVTKDLISYNFDVDLSKSAYPGRVTVLVADSGGGLTFNNPVTLGSTKLLVGSIVQNGTWVHGNVKFNRAVSADVIEIESGGNGTTTFAGDVTASSAIELDGSDTGKVVFSGQASATNIYIDGSENTFNGQVRVGDDLVVISSMNKSLTQVTGKTQVYFKNNLSHTNEELGLYGGDTYFQGSSVNSKGISIGFNDALAAKGSPFADFFDDNTAALKVYMENSKAQLFLDRNGLAIGSSVYVRNSGSLILRQDAKITGSLSVSSPKVISGSGVTTSKSIAGGIVVLGTSTLTVTGAVNFESLSTLVITRTASDTGKIVSDTSITFASQSIIQVSNQGSPGINSSNSVIATAPTINFSNVTIDGYSLQKQGNNLVIATSGGSGGTDTPGSGGTDTPGSGGTDTPGSGSGSGEIGGNTNFPESVADSVTSNPNYGAAISLVDAIVSHPSEAPALAAQITKVISAAAEEIEDNPELQIKALAQLAGEEALSSLNASVETAQVVTNAVSSRFAVLHGYSPTAPSAGYGAALNRLWVSAYGNWTKQKNMETIEGYSYDTFGVILGYDREIASIPGLSVGISAAFTDGKLKNNTGYAKTDIKTFSVSAYGSYQFGGGFFVDGLFGFGHSTNDADILQIIGNVRKTAAYDTNSFQAALTFGHDFYLTPNIRLTPSAGVQFVNVKQDGWAESIAADPDRLALAHWFGGSRKTFVDIPLKLALAAKTETGGVVFSTEVRAGAILAAKKSDNILQMGFVGSGRSALINGIDSTKTRFTGGVSLGIQINETVDVFIDYDLETRKKYISHSAAAGIGFSF